MAKYLNAIELSKDLKKRLEEIAIGDFNLKDKKLQEQLHQIVKSSDGLVSDILIEGAFSAKKYSQRLEDISFLSKDFIDLLNINKAFDPKFYPFMHQYETLKQVNFANKEDKPGIIVTAPTGAGKTESFLLPMLNDLVSNPRKKGEKGIRAIILYPMNALVADQNKRLYSYLKGQSDIKMFFYNSETPESERYVTNEDFKDDCFVLTREEARKNPPDIMITNYSMLEYILSRPNDYPLIGDALRTIIVDEAHLYTGTLAAEVSLLLRRVIAKSGVQNSNILYIATTATISGNDEEKIAFFSKFFNKTNILSVEGEKEVPDIDANIDINSEIEEFSDISSLIEVNSQALYYRYNKYNIFPKILKILSEKYTTNLQELLPLISEKLDLKTMLNILTIGAKARKNDNELPLLPHKLHLQARSPQGFSVCTNPECPDSRLDGIGKIHHGVFYDCMTCKSPTLYLVKCSECGEHFFYGDFDEKGKLQLQKLYQNDSISTSRGFALSFKESSSPIFIDKQGRKSSEHDYHNRFYKHSECPVCTNDSFVGLTISDQFIIPLVAETMVANMPEIDRENNIFLPARGRRLLTFSDSRRDAARLGPWLTEQHETQMFRRILTDIATQRISQNIDKDLKSYYEEEIGENELKLVAAVNPVIREKIIEKINELKFELIKMEAGLTVPELIKEINKHPLTGEFFDREKMKNQMPEERAQLSFKKNKEAVEKTIYERLANSLATPNEKSINLESMGILSFRYYYGDLQSIENMFSLKLGNHDIDINGVLNIFAYIFRKQRAISIENEFCSIKNHEAIIQGLGLYVVYDAKGKNLVNLKVTPRHYIYRFVASLLRSYAIDDTQENVHTFLETVYEAFLIIAKRKDVKWLEWDVMETEDGKITEGFRLVFYEMNIDVPQKLYINTTNNTIWQHAINGIVPERKGNVVQLQEISQEELDSHTYFSRYRNMYKNDSPELKIGLWAEEHSAQLSPKENRRLQNLFIQGKRNVLSSTTTLEVGIDIGGLSGVLMANIPPDKANYIQRSGRAGRRTDGSSMTLAYAKSRHFDQNVYRNFHYYMNKPLKKLTISLEKEKVATRHFNSFILSRFYEYNIAGSQGLLFDSFKKMGYFVGVFEIPKYTESKYAKFEFHIEDDSVCKQFLTFLETYTIDERDIQIFDEIFKHTKKDINYSELIRSFAKQVESVCGEYLRTLKELFSDWEHASSSSHKNAIRYNIQEKHRKSLIEIFSNNQILPKYGFPIDVKTLQVTSAPKMFELSRESFIALSEYVPGSKLLAGGMLIESNGISKHFTGENLDEAFGEKGFFYTCDRGHFFPSQYANVHQCAMEGCNGVVSAPSHYLIPEHGYITGASNKLSFKTSDPEKIGRVDVYSAIYTKSINDINFDYEDFQVIYREKTTIYGVNTGASGKGFAVCTKCGFAESERIEAKANSYDKLPTSFKNHPSIYSESPKSRCLESTPVVWRNYNLMAKMVTDAIIIYPKREIYNKKVAQTLANALQLSGSEELGIDEREINALVQEVDGSFNILIYDNRSGGVGYVYDLAKNRWQNWMDKTIERLYVDPIHDEECVGGCIKCVVTMKTNEPLPRKETLLYLRGQDGEKSENINKPKTGKDKEIKKSFSLEERMRKIQQRKRR